MSVEPSSTQRTVLLGEAKPPATMIIGQDSKACSCAPPSTGEKNFAVAFVQLRAGHQHELQQNKRPYTSPEQSPQQTRRRRSTKSGDSTDSEISKETEMLKITSPRKTGPTHNEQYLVEGGWQLIVRIALPEDYAAGFPTPDDYAT